MIEFFCANVSVNELSKTTALQNAKSYTKEIITQQ